MQQCFKLITQSKMIKLFKNIRKNLLAEGKTTNYLKYAIGEIVLVVIGILIALQINNWNQNRLATIEEQNIYKNLNTEFKANKVSLQDDIDQNNNSMASGKKLMDLIGADEAILKTENTDSLIFQFFESSDASFSENTILEIVQSGKMQYIQNDSIKNLILDWTQKKELVVGRYLQKQRVTNLLLMYLYKRYPIKNIDIYGILKWKESSRLNVDKFAIFNDVEFESLLDDGLYNLLGMIERQNRLQIVIEQIIKATEPYDH